MGPFQCNCRLLACPRTGEALLIDPGDEPGRILKAVESVRLPGGVAPKVRYLLHTHGHLDHISATRSVKEALTAQLPPVIALHRGDDELYRNLKMQGALFGLTYEDPLPVDHYLEDGESLRVGDLRLSVIHTPGHSPGSVSLRLHEDSRIQIPETVFTGDTLFNGSVGRTDLWGADGDQMFKSIRQRLLTLDDETRVCPGHGPESFIGIEKRENPFLV